MKDTENRHPDGRWKAGYAPNPEGLNGHTPITDSLRAILSRPVTDKLDDEPMNWAQAIALSWAWKARQGELEAAKSLSDRVEGKPTERKEITGKNGKDLLPENVFEKHYTDEDLALQGWVRVGAGKEKKD